MDARSRLLIIGPEALRIAVAEAAPLARVETADHAMDGVWVAGQEPPDAILMALPDGPRGLSAVRNLRKLAPQARIALACAPAAEPLAQQALEHGADEYLIEPLQSAELLAALRMKTAPTAPPASVPLAAYDDVGELGEVLRALSGGPRAALTRLAEMMRRTFGASGVLVELDGESVCLGDCDTLVLDAPVSRDAAVVGRVGIGRRGATPHSVDAAAKLTEYARLAEVIAAQARDRQRWQELAWTDELSGLRNRRYFRTALEELIRRGTDERKRITVLLFDIDDFKAYNDRYGHDTGDQLIREVAVLLRHCTREQDVVARYGGDEFAVLFWESDKPRQAGSEHPREPMALAERFCRLISEHEFRCLGRTAPGPVTISGGLACFPWNANECGQLIAAADKALFDAKRTGKNRIQLAGAAAGEASAGGLAEEIPSSVVP
jgi:diguanylate cyclase (GGDEF)-like protein